MAEHLLLHFHKSTYDVTLYNSISCVSKSDTDPKRFRQSQRYDLDPLGQGILMKVRNFQNHCSHKGGFPMIKTSKKDKMWGRGEIVKKIT